MALANQREETCRSTPVAPEFLDESAETDESPAAADTMQDELSVPTQEGSPLVVARETLEGSEEHEQAVTLRTEEKLQHEKISLDPPLLDPKTDPPESEISIHPLPRPKGNAKPALLVLDDGPMRDEKTFYGFLSYTIHW